MAKQEVYDAFNKTNNTVSMVKEFIKIVNSYKNQPKEIKQCFEAVTNYCSDESYFASVKDSIARQVDIEMLGMEGIDTYDLFSID